MVISELQHEVRTQGAAMQRLQVESEGYAALNEAYDAMVRQLEDSQGTVARQQVGGRGGREGLEGRECTRHKTFARATF